MGVFLQNRVSRLIPALPIAGSLSGSAGAEQTIPTYQFVDTMRGMWLGRLIGHAAGRFAMCQTSTFSLAPTVSEAVRIIGTPGGLKGFTTILELEVEGDVQEDAHGPTIHQSNT